MDVSNVAQLSVPQSQSLERRDQFDSLEKDVEFLSLRLLNKRGRVRLSPAGIDYSRLPGKSSLLAVGNAKGWFAVAIRKEDQSNHVLVSTLSELRTAFESGQADPEPFIPLNSRHSPFSVPGTPTILKFALNDERLIIGFLEGPVLVYITTDLFTSDQGSQPSPIFTFPGDASTIPRDILPNPGDSPELVAILRGVHGQDPGHQIDVLNVKELGHVAGWRKGSDPNAAPVSVSWSPKGKQIAIGLQSGDMIFYSPMSPSSPKSHLSKPRSTPAEASSLLSITWLTTPTFYTVFSTTEASSVLFNASASEPPLHTHLVSTHDSKSRIAIDVQLRDPCPPFGATRPPGPFALILRNWNPSKFIVLCGGGPSSDIGVFGTLPPDDTSKDADQWVSFNLEETSTPSLPLDEELNDLALLGLELDLTSSKSIRMSEQPDDGTPDLPPSPILYAYTNDGTIVAWHILNSSGEPYPGMNAIRNIDASPATHNMSQQGSSVQAFGMSSPRVSPPATQEPTSVFNQPSSSTSPPPSSAFSPPPTASFAPAKGFGAFGGASTSSSFGSTGFGFGGTSSGFGQSTAPPSFGSTSFGGSSNNQGEQGKPAPSSVFGTTGFGGSNTNQASQQKPGSSPAFGTTGFGQPSTVPTFGASSFGSKPAAPAFGQSSFGVAPAGTVKSAGGFGSTSGGFASFANQGSTSGGFASFATQGSSAFGAPVDSASSMPKATSPPAFGTGSFGQTSSPFMTSSAFGSGGQGPASPPRSAFGSGGIGQASATTIPSPSAFGQQGTQPTSAFGGFGKSSTTPAFDKSAFDTPSTPPARETGGFGGFGALGDALKASKPPGRIGSPLDSPPSPAGSLPDSPELRPKAMPEKPASSYLKPAEGFGSFNKPSEGFGAFGGEISSFINPGEGFGATALSDSYSAPVFDQQKETPSVFTPSTSSGAPAAPTFGSTSSLGHTKPVFGTSSFGSAPKPAVVDPSKPISGGFGAFSSGAGGFASFANAGKSPSFADILSSGESSKPKSDATPLAFGDASSKTPFDAPVSGSVFGMKVPSIPAGKSSNPSSAREPSAGSDGSDEKKKGKESDTSKRRFSGEKPTNQENSPASSTEGNPSFSLLSLGEAASQATPPVTSSPEGASNKEATSVQKAEDTSKGDDGEDTASEPFSLTDDGLDKSASEDDEQSPRSQTPSLPEEEQSARVTGSTTPRDHTPEYSPKPETTSRETKTPEVGVSSPPPEPSPLPATPEESSTTPPGSPEKPLLASQTAPAPAVPTPVVSASNSSPFGLGIGRPSSRPLRSSPLASAPITSAQDNDSSPDVSPSKSAPPMTKPKPTEPSPPFGQKPSASPVSFTPPPAISRESTSDPRPLRPKTPPLLGTRPLVPGTVPQAPGASVPLTHSRISPIGSGASARIPVQAVVAPPGPYPSPPPAAGEEEIPSHPMQVEFLRAYQEMTNELVQLYKTTQTMTMLRSALPKPRGMDRFVLADEEFVPGQYSQGDLKAFTAMVSMLQKKVVPLLELGDANKHSLRDLQNLALISETKQEEISRWVRARQDPDFADNLKPHTLGPEHSENQNRLRKAVQMARDRIQQCEDEMESLKKRLDQHKSGRVGFRPPSLDTIDRTCRNIQLALEERTKLLEQLQDRVETLSPKATQILYTSEATRPPVSNPRGATPPFASVAAAALNSERSLLKLKSALLSARKEPLLTTKVIKLESSSVAGLGSREPPQPQRPEWKLPPVPPLHSSTSSPLPSASRRAIRSGKKPSFAVPLKGAVPESNASTFDWGPLPGTAPMNKLSADVRNPKGRGSAAFSKQEAGDLEWDREAEHDYK